MTKPTLLLLLITISAAAQISVPEGTPVRLRLEQDLTDLQHSDGREVEFSVTEEVRVQGKTVIAVGARAVGNVLPGPDIAVQRVFAVDGSWLDLRSIGIRAAGLVRIDAAQGREAFERGATYLLYTDHVSLARISPPAAEDAGNGLLSWLNGKLTPVSGKLLLVIGVLYQFSEEHRG